MDRLQQLRDAGQSIWLDDITRASLRSGELRGWIEVHHLTGLTSNPSIFNLALAAASEYDAELHDLAHRAVRDDDALIELMLSDLREAADLFALAHEETDGVDGWVSIEVSPLLAYDAAASGAEAQRLHVLAARRNLFVKIPGTPPGIAAIEECTFVGVPINVTLLFSTAQYLAAAEAYLRGLERRVAVGLPPNVPSVASLFISRWDRAIADSAPPALRNRLGVTIAAQALEAYRALLTSDRWLRLQNHGARPQRLLWASLGMKDPAASDVLYLESLAAPLTIATVPLRTLEAFADHGRIEATLNPDPNETTEALAQFARADIDLDALAERMQRDGAEEFMRAWHSAVQAVASKRRATA